MWSTHSRFSALLLLAACGGSDPVGGGVTYTLSLVPVVPDYPGDGPFDGLTGLELEIIPSVGSSQVVEMELPEAGGTAVAGQLPALEDAVIEVHGLANGVLRSWGRTPHLTAGDGDDVTQSVLVSNVDQFGWIGDVPDATYDAGLISLGGGVFRVMGGLGNNTRGTLGQRLDTIREINLGSPASPPEAVDIGALPAWTEGEDEAPGDADTTHTERSGFQPHLLTAGPRAGQWLIAGGSLRGDCASSASITDSAFSYDAATGVFSAIPLGLNFGREDYLSVQDSRGNVVFEGGGVYDPSGGCYIFSGIERYNPEEDAFEVLTGGTGLGQVGGIAASVGTDGSLFCAGADFGGGGWTSVDACYFVSLDGEVIEADPLPVAVAGAAAVTLPSGEVLVTGGAHTNGEVSTPADAVNTAWVFDPTASSGRQWRTVSGAMALPRAGHRMAMLPDGRALLVGGAPTWNTFDPVDGGYACAEVYEPEDDGFAALSSGCDSGSEAGDLADRTDVPMLATDPEYGVFVLGGAVSATSGQSAMALFVPSPE